MHSIDYYDCTYNMKFCLDGYSKKGSNIYMLLPFIFTINLVDRNK